MYIINAPLKLPTTKTKWFYVSLNPFRNAHYFTLNKMKRYYKILLNSQIKELPKFDKVRITYTLFPKTKRLCDLMNQVCIQSKFFEDALVEADKIKDDNYLYIPEINIRFGKVDKYNPRVQIVIEEIE